MNIFIKSVCYYCPIFNQNGDVLNYSTIPQYFMIIYSAVLKPDRHGKVSRHIFPTLHMSDMNIYYEIPGSHSSEYKDDCLVGWHTM